MHRIRRGEAGESLIELLISVSILGIAVVAILGGLTTAVLVSGVHRNQAEVGTVLTAAAERVKEAQYAPCADMASYLATFSYPGYNRSTVAPDTLALAKPSGERVWTVKFGIADWLATGGFLVRPDLATCQSFDEQGARVQLVTLTTATADGKVSQTVRITKRFRECSDDLVAVSAAGCDGPTP